MKIPTYIKEYCDGRKCILILYAMRKEEKKREENREKNKIRNSN